MWPLVLNEFDMAALKTKVIDPKEMSCRFLSSRFDIRQHCILSELKLAKLLIR